MINMEIRGSDPSMAFIIKSPVLISAAIIWQAKYMERKGFWVSHLYFTVVIAFSLVNSFTFIPARKPIGKRLSNKFETGICCLLVSEILFGSFIFFQIKDF